MLIICSGHNKFKIFNHKLCKILTKQLRGQNVHKLSDNVIIDISAVKSEQTSAKCECICGCIPMNPTVTKVYSIIAYI